MPKKPEAKRRAANMGVERIFLDTNIILDIFDAKRPAHTGTLRFLEESLQGGDHLYVNSDTLTTVFYVLRSRKKISPKEALEALEKTLQFCELVPIDREDSLQAIALCKEEANRFGDYEDALQYICALKIGATLLLSNDRGFVSPDIETRRTL